MQRADEGLCVAHHLSVGLSSAADIPLSLTDPADKNATDIKLLTRKHPIDNPVKGKSISHF